MSVLSLSATIDGEDDIILPLEVVEWPLNGFLDVIDIAFFTSIYEAIDLAVTLDGQSPWGLGLLRIQSNLPVTFTLADTPASADAPRSIDLIALPTTGPSKITLEGTTVNFLRGGTHPVDLTLGQKRVSAIELFDADHTVRIRQGSVEALLLGDGDDTVTGGQGEVRSLKLGGGDNQLEGGLGRIGAIEAFDGDDTIMLRGGASQVDLGGGHNEARLFGEAVGTLQASGESSLVVAATDLGALLTSDGADLLRIRTTGSVSLANLGDGDDRVDIYGAGRAGDLMLGGGNNRVFTANETPNAITAFGGNDNVQLGAGGAGSINLGGGTNLLVGTSGFLGSFVSYGGADEIRLNGLSVTQMALGGGDNRVFAKAGTIESLATFDGADRINLGQGGAGHVTTGPGDDRITTGTGWVGTIRLGDGDDLAEIGAGGAELLAAGEGNDTLRATQGYVDLILAQPGDDVVRLGPDGAGLVSLGQGNDRVRPVPMANDVGIVLRGGAGHDILDLSAFDGPAVLRLDTSSFQNVFATGGALDLPGQGLFALFGIEGVIGTMAADRITGNGADDVLNGQAGADRLEGGFGADQLFGARGRDLLIGGMGADTLTGGMGADTMQGGFGADVFVILAGHGLDEIVDFEVGIDVISMPGVASLSELSFTQIDRAVRIQGDEISLLLTDADAAALQDDANFAFASG